MTVKRTLLVLAPSPGIGDFISRIPAIKLLARHCRVAAIFPLPEEMRNFIVDALDEPGVTVVLSSRKYRKSKLGILAGHFADLTFALTNRRPADCCVLMSDSNSSLGYIKYASMSRLMSDAPRFFAMADGRRGFPFHENIALESDAQKMKRYFDMACAVLSRLGIDVVARWDQFLPPIRRPPAETQIMLAPGGKLRTQWWPYFSDVADWLNRRGVRTVVVGSGDEAKLVEGVRRPGQEAMVGASLRDVSARLRQATVVICNDSGLLHLAVWSGAPVIAICGPGFAARWTGYPRERVAQLYYDRDPKGPETGAYRLECLKQIGVDAVLAELKRYVE